MNHATGLPPAEIEAIYRMGFTVGDHSARHIRRILRTFLGRWGMPELVDDAELALTELVANVVRHVPGSQCTLLIMRRPSGLRVEVTDACAGAVRPRHPSDPLAEDGRGLLLVEAVTDRWGCLVRGDGQAAGKTVWFECDAKPRRRARSSMRARQ